jgi:hypothetical protein
MFGSTGFLVRSKLCITARGTLFLCVGDRDSNLIVEDLALLEWQRVENRFVA